jgi:hypothetical protein
MSSSLLVDVVQVTIVTSTPTIITRSMHARARRLRVSPTRLELISRIRAEIAAGTYDTEAKMNEAVDHLVGLQ